MTEKPKAVGLFSGGLDSILAASIMQREGFDVIALYIYTGFNSDLPGDIARGPNAPWEPPTEIVETAASIGVRLRPLDISAEFPHILHHPHYGYGSAANPCIDCHTFFASKARQVMEEENAKVVFTGEVLGQRPMSQHRPQLELVAKRAGLAGMLLRPLSAKLLAATIPEELGLINRDHLYGFSGRSRTPQQELARSFGIDHFPQPGGGCLLTDPGFGRKYRDLIAHTTPDDPSQRDLLSLKTGRHLRLANDTKLIIGRNKAENAYLDVLFGDSVWRWYTPDLAGATLFAPTDPPEESFAHIAAIVARYSKGALLPSVRVIAARGADTHEYTVAPAAQDTIDPYLFR